MNITCSDCNLDKSPEDFNKSKKTKTGYQYKCRECERIYRNGNKQKIKERNKKYRQENHEKIQLKELERARIYRTNNREFVNTNARKNYNKEKRHKRYEKNRERDLNRTKEWRKNNIEKYRKYQNDWVKNERKTNPSYAIGQRLRSRLRAALKGEGKKQASLIELVGCSLEELKLYIQSLFTENMCWDEFFKGNIVIDHIKPCCSYDLNKEENQKACFHYTNLRPLWEKDNYDKIKDDLKQSLKLNNKNNQENNKEFIDYLYYF